MKKATKVSCFFFFERVGSALTGLDRKTRSGFWICAALTFFSGAPHAWTSYAYGTNCGRIVGLFTDIWSDGVFSVTLHDGFTASQAFYVDGDYDTMSFIHASLLAAKTAGRNVCLDVDDHDYVLSVTAH